MKCASEGRSEKGGRRARTDAGWAVWSVTGAVVGLQAQVQCSVARRGEITYRGERGGSDCALDFIVILSLGAPNSWAMRNYPHHVGPYGPDGSVQNGPIWG